MDNFKLPEIISHNDKQAVSARNLYECLGFNPAHWAKWYKKNITNNPFAVENQDYSSLTLSVSEKTRGNFAQDFALSLDFSKKIAMMARTFEGERIRDYFIECEKNLTANIGSGDYLTHEQVFYIMDLVKIFSYIDQQQGAFTANLDNHIERFNQKHPGMSKEFICAQFHNNRNKDLNITRDQIREMVDRYFDEEGRLRKIDISDRRKIFFIIDPNLLISHAAYDYMSALGKNNEYSLKVGGLVKKFADHMNPEIRRNNEPDLFHIPEEFNRTIERNLSPYLPKNKKLLKAKSA